MRDVVNLDRLWPGTYRAQNFWGSWDNPINIGVTRKTVRSFRSEAVSTQKVGDGYVRPTTYSAFFSHSTPQPGSARWEERISGSWRAREAEWLGGYWWVDPWYLGCTPALAPDIPTALRARARSRVRESVKLTDLNLAQSLGELRQSLHTIGDLFYDAVELILKIIKLGRKGAFGAFGDGGGLSGSAANEYLRYTYGLRPIMNDVYSLVQGIRVGDVPIATKTVNLTDSTFNSGSLRKQVNGVEYVGSFKRGIEVSVTYTVPSVNMAAFDAWRLGLTNPVSLLWELLTLSFVIDWFTGIGAFLEAQFGPAIGLVFLHGYETSYVSCDFTVVCPHQAYVPNEISGPNIRGSTQKRRTNVRIRAMQRVAQIDFPVPNVYFNVPLGNLRQGLTALALARQRMG